MVTLISIVIVILGILSGVSGEECPTDLQCLSVPSSCLIPMRANITLSDNTICPACQVCIPLPPRPRPRPVVNLLGNIPRRLPSRPRVRNPCPTTYVCPMWERPEGCDMEFYSQWIKVNDVICYMCSTWRCK